MTAVYLDSFAVQADFGAGFVPLGLDVRDVPIVCRYGIDGHGPNERIASAGSLEFGLNNSARNVAQVLGYYSPLHASKRSGFAANIPIRLVLAYNGQTRYKFRGRLSEMLPTPGLYADRITLCVARDLMDDWADLDLPDLATQLNQRGDQLTTSILDALPSEHQPAARSIETGLETYSYALDGGAAGNRPKVREVLNQIAMSGLEYHYFKGDAVQGGTYMVENRHHRASNPTVLLTLPDTLIAPQGLSAPTARDDIYSRVQVFVKPTRVDAAATTVLFALQSATVLVQPGETISTIFGPYRDPATNDQIGGTAVVAPVATTDYTMNTASDGSGTDLTSSFTVTASATGLGVRFTAITNNGTVAGYVTKLQVRGKGVYRYEAMVEYEVAGAYGDRVLAIVMPYQNSVNVAQDVGTYYAQQLSVAVADVRSVTFLANKSATLMEAAVLREPGDRIALSETVTGINAEFTINAVRLELQPGGILWCTYGLEPATTQRYWVLGLAGASELGDTTVLGF